MLALVAPTGAALAALVVPKAKGGCRFGICGAKGGVPSRLLWCQRGEDRFALLVPKWRAILACLWSQSLWSHFATDAVSNTSLQRMSPKHV